MVLNRLIALSGACHSGKTTVIERMKQEIPEVGVALDPIRQTGFQSIDELRKDPSRYLSVLGTAINMKISQEDDMLNRMERPVWLVDRSLVDSLFYLSFYLDKADLCVREREIYFSLVNRVISLIPGRYAAVAIFEPIPIEGTIDSMRPADLAASQQSEHKMIEALTLGLLQRTGIPIIRVDARSPENLINLCKNEWTLRRRMF